MTMDQGLNVAGALTVIAPIALLAVVGISMLGGWTFSERLTSRLNYTTIVIGFLASVAMLALMLISGQRNVLLEVGDWIVIPQEHFHFHLKFMFDRLSVPFAILSYVLLGTIGAFASQYLHREPGYHRFFLLYAVFLVGMIAASLAGTIETLFLGWELVGLSSALLVAYFHERTAPVINGQRVWSVYRVADAAFLVAAVALHHLTGQGDFVELMGRGPWPEGHAALSSNDALVIGLLLLVAVAGKSALIPFCGWLPRAMEGPTPSSAVFYGALSVHLGTFLLLRVSPILELSIWLSVAVVVLGVASAMYAALAGRVQTDVKSALAFASLTQVGIITAEIGLGLRYIPLVHIIGHATLRTLQLVRAPTLLHDYHTLENAIGAHLPAEHASRWLPSRFHRRLYSLSLERGHLDSLINEYIIWPFVCVFRQCDAMERKWTDLLAGRASRQSDRVREPLPPLEEYL